MIKKKWRICLWASTQENNIGVNDYGTEEQNMFRLCDMIEGKLNKYDCFDILRNQPEWGLIQNVNQERSNNIDFVVELHTNAGGGEGTEVFCNTNNPEGMKLASILYRYISPISEGKDRGIKDGMQFYDIKNTYSTAVLAELFFHDNKEEVIGWRVKTEQYADAIVNAILEFVNIKSLENDSQINDNKLADLIGKISNSIYELEQLITDIAVLREKFEEVVK